MEEGKELLLTRNNAGVVEFQSSRLVSTIKKDVKTTLENQAFVCIEISPPPLGIPRIRFVIGEMNKETRHTHTYIHPPV